MSRPGNNVCVVGAGVVGLLALKNLREQGLNAIAFTKDDHIGGLWVKPEQLGKTTALRATTANTSKQTVSREEHNCPRPALCTQRSYRSVPELHLGFPYA